MKLVWPHACSQTFQKSGGMNVLKASWRHPWIYIDQTKKQIIYTHHIHCTYYKYMYIYYINYTYYIWVNIISKATLNMHPLVSSGKCLDASGNTLGLGVLPVFQLEQKPDKLTPPLPFQNHIHVIIHNIISITIVFKYSICLLTFRFNISSV